MGSVDMPDDDAIERMARVIHANFRNARHSLEAADHPALAPWEDLDESLRAQNREQARDNVVKLASLGLRAVPCTRLDAGEEPAAGVDERDVEALARSEHDRWARQKMAQGYRYGAERADDGPDKRHPDLLAWEDLPEHVRDKDRAPVRQMIGVLVSAGFTVVVDSGSS